MNQSTGDQNANDSGFLFTTTSSSRIEEAKLNQFRDAQKADPILAQYFNLERADLTLRGIQMSPQGIFYEVVDGKYLMMVPRELCQQILVENLDVPTIGHVVINRTVDPIKWNY